MQNYLDAATLAIDSAIAKTTAPPEMVKTTATYAETQGADKFVGEAWGKAPDEPSSSSASSAIPPACCARQTRSGPATIASA